MTLRLTERPFGRCIVAALFAALTSTSSSFAKPAPSDPAPSETGPSETGVTKPAAGSLASAAVIETYANIAHAAYGGAHAAARAMQDKTRSKTCSSRPPPRR